MVEDDGDSVLDDAGFFVADILDSISEILLMIQSDAGDSCDDGCTNICRIESTAHTYLEDGVLHSPAREEQHGYQCALLKI